MKHACSICNTSSMTHSDISKSLEMSKALHAGLSTLHSLTHVFCHRLKGEKNSKSEHSPDVGQNTHVFAFMLWNLYYNVATLVQGIAHISLLKHLQLFLYFAIFYIS